MPVAVITSKGQITIPKEVRVALGLKTAEKVVIVLEGGQAVLSPLSGSVLDLGGSMKRYKTREVTDFGAVRAAVRKVVGRRTAARG